MPWRQEPMKDVAGDEMLRGAASKRYHPEISEWGNPPRVMPGYGRLNQIGRIEETEGTETSKYLEEQRIFRE